MTIQNAHGSNPAIDKTGAGIFLPRYDEVRHLIESGSLVYTYLDLETTDKDWKTAEITVASLTITDIGFNLISDDLFEVCVPDRVGLSPEAMLITRYMASKLRQTDRLSPQHAAAGIFEAVQDAPRRLWDLLGRWKETLGEDKWREYVDEKYVSIPGKTGLEKPVLVRHFPMLDKHNNIVKYVRVHEPQDSKEFMDMSYLIKTREAGDYSDAQGSWKVRKFDKYNLGFRNTFFDNRLMAAALFRANFPQKELYALNKKALGNHAADVFTMAISDHFFGDNGKKTRLGTRIDAETTREKISAKLDLLMEENTQLADNDIGLPEGVRVSDGSLHNLKRGHNAPDYDNAKSIGLHRYIRRHNPKIVQHIEQCGQVDYFRRFMTHDIEDGVPTTHPIRFGIISANDDQIYRAVPLIVLGSDDQHGKFNKVWTVRADMDYETELYNGKRIPDLSTEELAEMIRVQKGQPDAVFQEVHLKRHRGVFDLETGLKAGHARGLSKEALRYRRDALIDYLDEHDRTFLSKALDAFSMQYSFSAPADNIPQPFVEEEIWTAMGDIKYAYVTGENGKKIKLPNVIREMAQDEFKRLNDRIGDSVRAILKPQPLEWKPTQEKALAYARLRAKQEKKINDYQSRVTVSEKIELPFPEYPFSNSEILSKKSPPVLEIEDVYATLIQDRLHLMDKLTETTRAYEVQQYIYSGVSKKYHWQTIPFDILAAMQESRILNLRDEGRLRIRFEENPNRPAFRFAIRYFMENKMEDLLTQAQRDFYTAETSAYVHGPIYIPDPEQHRIMSAAKIRLSVDKIRQNIKAGEGFLSATREGETGAFHQYANDNFGESILENVERDTKRRAKEYPFTDTRKYIFGINPATNEPLLNVKFEIPAGHTKITIPDGLSSATASHPQFGHTCIVIPPAVDVKSLRHIVLEEEKTKRKYYAAGAVLHELPPRSVGAYDVFYRAIDKAYTSAGHLPPTQGYVLSCEEIVPVSRPRDNDFPSLRIPMNSLIATRNPELGHLQRTEPLTGFLMRKYDIKLRKNQKIILRGVDRSNVETGWESFADISGKPIEFTLKDLIGMVDDPSRSIEADQMAACCGYGTAQDMKAAMLGEFTKFDEDILHPKNELIFFRIKPIKSLNYWQAHQPRAAFENNILQSKSREKNPKKTKLAAKSPILSPEP